jgi:hypothetical protein
MSANGALVNSPDKSAVLIPPNILKLPDLPEGPSHWTATHSEKFQKEKQPESDIMILEITHDYMLQRR